MQAAEVTDCADGTTTSGENPISGDSAACRNTAGGIVCHPSLSLKNAMDAKVGTKLHVCTFVPMT